MTGQIPSNAVQQKVPSHHVEPDVRDPGEPGGDPGLKEHEVAFADVREELTEVLDEHRLAPYAGVPNPRHEPSHLVERAEEVDQSGLRDVFHGVFFLS